MLPSWEAGETTGNMERRLDEEAINLVSLRGKKKFTHEKIYIYSLAIFRSLATGIGERIFTHSLPTIVIPIELVQCIKIEWVVGICVCESEGGSKHAIRLAFADHVTRSSSTTLGLN